MKLRLETWVDDPRGRSTEVLDLDVTPVEAGKVAMFVSNLNNITQVRILHEGQGQALARDGWCVWFEDFARKHDIPRA